MGLLRRRKDPFITALEPLVKGHAEEAGLPCSFVAEEDKYVVGEMQIQLANLRHGWAQRGADEQGVWLDTAIRGLFTTSIPDELTAGDTDHVMVGLRSRATIEHVRLTNLAEQRDDTSGIPARAVTDDLGAVLLWDTPTTMGVINKETLSKWGHDFGSLYSVGRDNLRSLDSMGWAAIDNRTFALLDVDDYVAARLLLPDFLDDLPLSGPVVAIVPNRSTLIVAALDDIEGVQTALDLALQELDQPAQVSLRPIVGYQSSWSALHLDPDHPGYRAWRHLTRVDAAICADSTRQPLERLLGEDLFVASLIIRENDDGVAESICTWSRGVPSLLTRADMVAFTRGEGDVQLAEWDRVAAALGPMLEPTTYFPSRYRVLDFPTDEQLAALAP